MIKICNIINSLSFIMIRLRRLNDDLATGKKKVECKAKQGGLHILKGLQLHWVPDRGRYGLKSLA